jgi:hypothetical protein
VQYAECPPRLLAQQTPSQLADVLRERFSSPIGVQPYHLRTAFVITAEYPLNQAAHAFRFWRRLLSLSRDALESRADVPHEQGVHPSGHLSYLLGTRVALLIQPIRQGNNSGTIALFNPSRNRPLGLAAWRHSAARGCVK